MKYKQACYDITPTDHTEQWELLYKLDLVNGDCFEKVTGVYIVPSITKPGWIHRNSLIPNSFHIIDYIHRKCKIRYKRIYETLVKIRIENL